MKRSDKIQIVEDLKAKFAESTFFYITDSSTLSVAEVNKLRALCFEKDIEMQVVKNTFVEKALEGASEDKGYKPLFEALKGPTSLMFSNNANEPAKLIKEFRKSHPRPLLKAAYIDSDVFLGDESLEKLVNLKSKEDLLGEVIVLLQSPMKNVISGLKSSGGNKIAGLLKALEERAQ